MAKLPNLAHIKYVRTKKGQVYAYFNTGQKGPKGTVIYARLPAPSSVGFHDSYAAMLAVRTKRAVKAFTVADLAVAYEGSKEFAGKAAGTRSLYGKTIRRIVDLLGDFEAHDLQRADVQLVLDHEMAGPGAHNIFLAVIGVLYAWGRGRGLTTTNPTEGITKAKTGSHEPWPEHVLEAGLQAEEARVRLAVHLLYFTGQRIGDVLRLRWSDIRKGKLHVVPQKTERFAKRLTIPLHSELADELDATPRLGLTIMADGSGRPLRQAQIRAELQRFTETLGFKTVPHGLRKNAVNSLLEAGGSVAEVAAITGQTYQIVEHYAARVNTAALGESVILKLENKRGTGKRMGKTALKPA